ncbi:hypothetical protein K470DRAFT_264367 [Piedraia hortae CBS 480.64]|uniref:Uncharacterized protein n=1 Tax=Piedraia hortae CBS 480.64 TaxID=1314780 RepID=A0A6A7BZK0_9PEZI|nr:hypothetical protein K470DRAFT_264367 [Piedraia hortae CBS 480.64]
MTGFDLMPKRLYGCAYENEEGIHVEVLFAITNYLGMQEGIEKALNVIINRMMTPIPSCQIRLISNKFYGLVVDLILASVKAALCRDGWKMPLIFWSEFPSELVRDVVGGTSFHVDSEWCR